ncbi:MAG: hypothetical protein NTZ07_02490 [Candidatus Woesebacteria bacterium]|nr:hypothetical protein [Candidatus Woesebacteria bacterium]
MKMLAQLDFGKITLPTTGTRLVNINDPNLKIGSIIGAALTYIFGAAGIALLIYLVLGGLQMMTSRGDPKAMQSAQAKITNALIGFVIVIFAYFIVQIFGQIFGLQGTLFGQIFK